ncbi:MAG: hypothetical protein U0T78_08885 [Cloacibacterium normanense]
MQKYNNLENEAVGKSEFYGFVKKHSSYYETTSNYSVFLLVCFIFNVDLYYARDFFSRLQTDPYQTAFAQQVIKENLNQAELNKIEIKQSSLVSEELKVIKKAEVFWS